MSIPKINNAESNYYRKSTFDDTENNMVLKSSPAISSPEEKAMQKKIVSSFNLNLFPFENIEEDQDDNEELYVPLIRKEGELATALQNEKEDEYDDMLKVFQPFVSNDAFQNSSPEEEGSSGPIFSLMSRATNLKSD